MLLSLVNFATCCLLPALVQSGRGDLETGSRVARASPSAQGALERRSPFPRGRTLFAAASRLRASSVEGAHRDFRDTSAMAPGAGSPQVDLLAPAANLSQLADSILLTV